MSKKMFFSPIGAGLDVDVVNFLTATGITGLTIINLLNTFVTTIKPTIWSKIKAVYPIVGGTEFTHKFNLKDPRDLDVAFRITFSNGFTHSATGMSGNGIGYANTHLSPFLNLTLNNTHLSNYCRTNTADNIVDIGANDTITSYLLYQRFSNLFVSDCYNGSTNRNTIANTDSRGFYLSSRTSANMLKMYKNNSTLVTSTTTQTSAMPNVEVSLASMNGVYLSNREYTFFSIGDGLTDAEELTLYNAVQALQIGLGRQI